MQIVPGAVTHVAVYGGATGAITACTVTEAAGPFTYEWDDGSRESDRSSLAAGVYVLTVRDQSTGESTEHTYEVTQNGPIAVTTPGTITNAAFGMNTGSIGPPVVSGGDGTYRYSWRDWLACDDPTRSDLSPGNYVLIINDEAGNATVLQTYTVGEYDPLAISVAGSVRHVSVAGDATGEIGPSVFAGGSADYFSEWEDDPAAITSERTGLAAGEYTLRLKDGCGSTPQTHVFVVRENTAISVVGRGRLSPSFGVSNGSIGMPQIEGGNGFYVFTWRDNVAITSPTRTELDEGVYTMYVSDTEGAEPCEVEYVVPKYDVIEVTPGTVHPSIGIGADNGIIFSCTVTGGSGNFSLQWDDQTEPSPTSFRSGLAYGHYTLTLSDLDDMGSSAEVHYTVKQHRKPAPKRPAHRLRLPGL